MQSHDVTREPTARSLVLELLSVLGEDGPHGLPVASLLRAGQLFDLEGGAIRVALSRLRARGLVEAPRRGHYRLAPA
ncbi:MAG TPA: hypothetical protein RMI62_06225, partial [Polyangiaceae bacterium LLY-WYZ-15_(1-7)]|nr:hypothetical protein [Polyangiaceae bacterium LLY-WYZ-15_(1-7)]